MSKKPKRGAPAIDMTAMVDVAFLLLTFFILTTTQFREDTAIEVDAPSSASPTSVPETKMMTIFVSDSGAVFVGFSDPGTREGVLNRMIQTKSLDPNNQLTADGAGFFTTVQNFGVPQNQLIRWLNMTSEEKVEFVQPGIPYRKDSLARTINELKDWVEYGRRTDPRMRFAIRGDGGAPYPVVKQVINTLQEWNINRMSLVTAMEEPPDFEGGL
ncbi:biopolymer transporter ExbD [bacterium]|nr:biopolymer transporter ExbD [bacterium]